MKRSDVIVILACLAILSPFFIVPAVFQSYQQLNAAHAYLLSFIKFALLATFGECLGLRIKTGSYNLPGFGILPRALVWGVLGIAIKGAFVVFGEGVPVMMQSLGFSFPTANPAAVLREPAFSGIKLLAAFGVSAVMNIIFAPVFMAFHRITDTHILKTGGTLKGFFSTFRMGEYIRQIDWFSFWDFVVKRTIPWFWIPAQTFNFMLPEGYRVLVAAVYGVILGVFLSVASLLQQK